MYSNGFLLYLGLFCFSIASAVQTGPNSRFKVIIIGAGPAGIAAASRLAQNNETDFIILEARNRIGGRINSIPVDGELLEMGAQYIHGEDGNSVYNMVKNMDIYEHNVDDISNLVMIAPDDVKYNNNYSKLIFEIMDNVTKFGNGTIGVSYDDFFIPRYQIIFKLLNMSESDNEIMIDAIKKAEGVSNAGQTNELGAYGVSEYKTLPGDLAMTWKKGYGYTIILDILMGKFPKGAKNLGIEEKIILNKEVNKVQWDDEGTRVHCTDGSVYTSDRVITTQPLGVLKAIPNDFFQPPLPKYKVEAIQAIGFGTVNKIHLKFDEKWWNFTEGFNFGMSMPAISQYETTSKSGSWPTKLTGFYSVNKMPLMLISWISGPSANEVEKLTDDEVMEGCYDMLKTIYRHDLQSLRAPSGIIRSKWHSEPYTRGSYSFRTVESDTKNITNQHLAEPLLNSQGKPVVMFAGEATNVEFYSTVHGAIESGWREANRILNLNTV